MNFKYLALGDSYTIGECVPEQDSFPYQLANKFALDNINVIPKIIAKTGWTTDELINAIENENISDLFDFVTLLIGVNNQYRGRPLDNFKTEFKILLNIAVKFSAYGKKNVFVLSIPDWGVTPFAASKDTKKIADEIDSFNLVIKNVCEKENIKLFDITKISRGYPNLVASDSLHPSADMYKLWVDLIYSDIKNSLTQLKLL